MARKTMHGIAKPSIFRNAHALRIKSTEAEKILWEYLRNKRLEGIKFRRQHPKDNYVLDFFANKLKLLIEIDGPYHQDQSMQFQDMDRDHNLALSNIVILRFTNDQVFDSIDLVVETIRSTIKQLQERYQE
jgi:very-short-patch-repair endonuclease